MSVGASSIKRAARTAAAEEPKEAGTEGKAAENVESAAERGAAGASAKASRNTKNTKSRMPQKASAADKPKTSAAENDAAAKGQAYEAYGIGQQLPVHLL